MKREKSKEEFFAVVSAIAKFIENTDKKASGTHSRASKNREEREENANHP